MPNLNPTPRFQVTGSRTSRITVFIEWFPDERVSGVLYQLTFSFFGQDRGEPLRGADDPIHNWAMLFRSNGSPTQTIHFIHNLPPERSYDEDDPIPVPFPIPSAWSERDEVYYRVTIQRARPETVSAQSNVVTGFF